MIRGTWVLLLGLAGTMGCIDLDFQEDNDSFSCETTGEPCETTLVDSSLPRDACDAVGTTNLLVGTCWMEQCRDGEKSLFPKTEGVPCIRKPSSGNSPWEEGTCDGEGVCVGSGP